MPAVIAATCGAATSGRTARQAARSQPVARRASHHQRVRRCAGWMRLPIRRRLPGRRHGRPRVDGWDRGQHASRLEFGVAYHSRAVALSTAGGRIGYGWGRFLGYVKGGGAWERDNYWATTIITGPAYTTSVTRQGWTIGAGGEYAISSLVSLFAEYNYCDFGTSRIGLTPILVGLPPGIRRPQADERRHARRAQLALQRFRLVGRRILTLRPARFGGTGHGRRASRATTYGLTPVFPRLRSR